MQLDRVVLLGCTFEEHRRYFLLQPQQLIGKKILDAAGGVSSFCAEANSLDIKIKAFDPIYSLSSEKSGNDPMPIWNRFTEPSDEKTVGRLYQTPLLCRI